MAATVSFGMNDAAIDWSAPSCSTRMRTMCAVLGSPIELEMQPLTTSLTMLEESALSGGDGGRRSWPGCGTVTAAGRNSGRRAR